MENITNIASQIEESGKVTYEKPRVDSFTEEELTATLEVKGGSGGPAFALS